MLMNYNQQSEREFPELKEFDGMEKRKANTHENRIEHWDWEISNVKYDVKGQKKVSSRDSSVSNEFTWVEYQTYSHPGWLFGHADKIAFEFCDSFIITDRKKLVEHMESTMTDPNIYSTSVPYKFKERVRKSSKDIIVLVPMEDIVKISDKIIQK